MKLASSAALQAQISCISVLFFLGGCHYVNVSVACAMLELNGSVNECIQGMILAHAHIHARTMNCATLTTDDVASLGKLTTINFHAKSLAVRLTTVLRTTYTFFMCHNF